MWKTNKILISYVNNKLPSPGVLNPGDTLSFKTKLMRLMFSKWTILFSLAGILAACSHVASSAKDVDVLTGSPWKYEKAGFDNDDGTFDALDPQIVGSDRDNTIVFCKDGSGYSHISRRTAGMPDKLPFLWSFQNNDSTIYFQNQYYRVKVLTEQRLEMYADQRYGSTSIRYTIILKR